jgi:hypothetical protein
MSCVPYDLLFDEKVERATEAILSSVDGDKDNARAIARKVLLTAATVVAENENEIFDRTINTF